MKKRDKILQAAKQRLTAAFGDKIKDVILFGSRAWGKPTRWSDYDMVVVVRGDYDWRFRHDVSDVMTDIDLDYSVYIQALVVSENELKNTSQGYEPVFVKALSQGIYA
ncbi:MAG: nucleotidyltransferase domain-containing protein [Saprospiraceae bacterium]